MEPKPYGGYTGHKTTVRCMAADKKSCQQFVSGGDEGELFLWKFGQPEPQLTFEGPAESVICTKLVNGKCFAGYHSGVICHFDVATGKLASKFCGHGCPVKGVDVHPSGTYWASCSSDGVVKLWDIRGKKTSSWLRMEGINVVRFSPDGRWVAAGCEGGKCALVDVGSGRTILQVGAHSETVNDVQFHPSMLLLASADRTAAFTDLDLMRTVNTGSAESQHIECLLWTGKGTDMCWATNSVVKMVAWEPFRVISSQAHSHFRVRDMAFSGGVVLLGSTGGRIFSMGVERQAAQPSTGQPAKSLDSVVGHHSSFLGVMRTRRENLERVMGGWDWSNVRGAVEAARGHDDVLADVLGVVGRRRDLWTLDLVAVILEPMGRLLCRNWRYDWVLGGLLREVLGMFGGVIRENLNYVESIGVDLSGNERREKCRRCRSELVRIGLSLQGRVGEHQQKELIEIINSLIY